jgi:hypothetical protein
MTFLNASILIGAALVAIPVVLHLLMRRQPQLVTFPALRFVQQRRISNQRTLRLRHWLLLVARCLLIALLVLALAGPTVDLAKGGSWVTIGIIFLAFFLLAVTAIYSWSIPLSKWLSILITIAAIAALCVDAFLAFKALTTEQGAAVGDTDAPVAAVLVFDTSARMMYTHEDQTRLEVAQELAGSLIRKLPDGSQIAIADLSPRAHTFSVDRAAAEDAISQLKVTYNNVGLDHALGQSLDLLTTSQLEQKEIYVFTDMARSAWNGVNAGLARRFEEPEKTPLYLLDVAAEEIKNAGLGDAELSQSVITASSQVEISVDVFREGEIASRSIELWLEKQDLTLPVVMDDKLQTPELMKRGEQEVVFEGQSEDRVSSRRTFVISDLPPGMHHGQIRIVGSDGFMLDNVRHFTIEVRNAWPILIVAPDGVATRFLTQAISPLKQLEAGTSQFQPDVVRQSEFVTQQLTQYSSVYFIDPAPLTDDQWAALNQFANLGGGIAIFLGNNADPNQDLAQSFASPLIGATVGRQWRGESDNFFDPTDPAHGSQVFFRELDGSVPWSAFPIFRYWSLDNLAETARVIIRSSDSRRPLLIENVVGKGRVLTMATPISDPFRIEGRRRWNNLVSGENNWPYFLLINGLVSYTSRSGDDQLNYFAGQMASLSNEKHHPERYQLFLPSGEIQPVVETDEQILIRSTDQIGSYRLKGDQNGVVLRGFSTNVPVVVSDLTAIDAAELESVFGEGGIQIARNEDEIDTQIRKTRVGYEVFPLLMVILAVITGLEHVISNRFYPTSKEG